MAEENQNNILVNPANPSVKRKRGRPRKDDVPGSESAKRRPYRKAEQNVQSGDVSVGQAVSGVIDGKFDAGYMLTVTIGNSGTVLTGVVFEPGRVVPISAANDVAPEAPTLKRVEVPMPSSRHLSQRILKKDEVTLHSKGSSVRSTPEILNVKPPIGSLVDNTKVQVDQNLVSNSASQVLHSHLNLKNSSSPHGHTNQNSISEPQSLASEPKEVQATNTSEKELVEGTTKTSLTNSLTKVAAQTPASEPVNLKVDETSDDKPVITKEQLVDSAIMPQVTIQASDHEKERTLDLLGREAGSIQTGEPSVEVSNGTDADNTLMGNVAVEEIKAPLEQNSDTSAHDLETDSQPKNQSQAPEPKPQTFPTEPSTQQPSDVTESSKDLDPQTSIADTGSNVA